MTDTNPRPMHLVVAQASSLCEPHRLKACATTPPAHCRFTGARHAQIWRGLSRLLPLAALIPLLFAGCRTAPRPGTFAPRRGDEIIVAGQPFHTGTRVVTWMDPGGYDAYRVERRFAPFEEADWEKSKAVVKDLDTPNRYNLRRHNLSTNDFERVRNGGWDLPTLQHSVDQFVLHYDVCGTSRRRDASLSSIF